MHGVREYFIWFGGDSPEPTEMQVALRFTATGQVDPNWPESGIGALGIAPDAAATYPRHYCLGAVR